MMDKKTFAIGVLSLSAVILLAANFLAPRGVIAADSIQDNDYSMQTARSIAGGDALFVTDKRTGMMAVFIFDPQKQALINTDVQPVQNAFANMAGGPTRRP
ncbi:MAG: hypothetical protein JWL69_5029 [Phycisphaerales bacterium]|jgi:hypothetical protein|nr:hypothetical protein [Phycisphaerales bacterium]MDB5330211.1 hypothetical protein [Phycisphaerales bacterium]MDB5353700.1 hypothetical protein [Phycisphaerales bacterium]